MNAFFPVCKIDDTAQKIPRNVYDVVVTRVTCCNCMMIEDQFLQTRITIVTTQQCFRMLNGSGVNNKWTVSGTCCIK